MGNIHQAHVRVTHHSAMAGVMFQATQDTMIGQACQHGLPVVRDPGRICAITALQRANSQTRRLAINIHTGRKIKVKTRVLQFLAQPGVVLARLVDTQIRGNLAGCQGFNKTMAAVETLNFAAFLVDIDKQRQSSSSPSNAL